MTNPIQASSAQAIQPAANPARAAPPPSSQLVANLTPQEAARFDGIAARAAAGEPVAAAQLEELTTLYEAREKGRLAQDVYDSAAGIGRAPEGWLRASEQPSPALLRSYGLNPNHLTGGANSDFRAEFYVPDPNSTAIPQDAAPVLVFRGSTAREGGAGPNLAPGADWRTNAEQGFGRETDHYTRAMEAARSVSQVVGSDFEIAGHSLGGGLGAAASAVSGAKATLFNAAGLHDDTARRFAAERNLTLANTDSLVTTYQVRGEVLTGVQQTVVPAIRPSLVAGATAATLPAAAADTVLDGGALAARGAAGTLRLGGDAADLTGRATGGIVDGAGRILGGAADLAGDVLDGGADLVGDAAGGTVSLFGRGLGWVADRAGLGGDNVRGAFDGAGNAIDGGFNAAGDLAERGTGVVSNATRGATGAVADALRYRGALIERGADGTAQLIDDGLRALSGIRAATDWAAHGGLIESAMRAGPAAAGQHVQIDAFGMDEAGNLTPRPAMRITDPGAAIGESVDRHLMDTVLPSLDARIDRVEARQ